MSDETKAWWLNTGGGVLMLTGVYWFIRENSWWITLVGSTVFFVGLQMIMECVQVKHRLFMVQWIENMKPELERLFVVDEYTGQIFYRKPL